jgi:TPR repeat protein
MEHVMNEIEVKNIQAAAQNQEADAQFELGQLYEYGKGIEQDYSKAMHWYKLAAKSGLFKAEYSIALLYEKGRGVELDYVLASEWYQKAADKGDPWSQTNLAFLYSHGRGVKQSDKTANELYRKAAEQGHFQAQFNLGARYASGRGTTVDLPEAHYWFQRSRLGASALNQERANKAMEALEANMSSEECQLASMKFDRLLGKI